MKKFFIPLILLCGFIISVPQVAFSDVLIHYSPEETRKLSNEVVESFKCFYEKKLNTPTNYEGQNLKLQEVPYYSYNPSLRYRPPSVPENKYYTNVHIKAQNICDLFPKETTATEHFDTSIVTKDGKIVKNEVREVCLLRDYEVYDREEDEEGRYTVNSFVSNCKEYVEVFANRYRGAYGYDVTDVPPGSYLKYIPETHEVQVISNNDDSYKKDIPSKISALKTEGSKFRKAIRKDNIKAFFRKNINKIRYGAETKEEGERLARKKSFECLGKKKSKLPQKYSGKDIKLKSCDDYKNSDDENNFYYKLCSGSIDFSIMTKNHYFIETFREGSKPHNEAMVRDIDTVLGSKKTSRHNNCHEYINFGKYFADITNVPQGSYLKYLPDNDVLKVISPVDEDYKNIVKSVTEKFLCIYNKKLNLSQENTETTLKPKSNNEVGKHFKETGLVYYDVYENINPLGKLGGGATGNNNIWAHRLESVVFLDETNCNEYVYVGNDTYYDVTNIPPYSYFKYIPENKEMKVLFSETDLYKQQISDAIKDMENRTKELQGDETLKNTIAIVGSLQKLRRKLLRNFVSHNWMSIQNFVRGKEDITSQHINIMEEYNPYDF